MARSALERPRCGNVLGGDCLPLREARKLSEDDLLSFVRKSVAPYLRQSMSKKPDQATLRKSRATLMRDLVERVGNPVRTEATLKSAIARKGVRVGFILGLAGELPVSTMWRLYPGAPVNVARAVFGMAEEYPAACGRRRRYL